MTGDKLSEYEATTKQVETMKNDLQDEYEQMQTVQTELEGEESLSLQPHWKISSLRSHSWIKVFRMR